MVICLKNINPLTLIGGITLGLCALGGTVALSNRTPTNAQSFQDCDAGLCSVVEKAEKSSKEGAKTCAELLGEVAAKSPGLMDACKKGFLAGLDNAAKGLR